jgi:D-lactate dehydrogenase
MKFPHALAKIVGYNALENVTRGLFKVGDGLFPLWTRYTPSGSRKIARSIFPANDADAPTVVYFPSCITRAMGGPSFGYDESADVPRKCFRCFEKPTTRSSFPKGKTICVVEWLSVAKDFENRQRKKKESLTKRYCRQPVTANCRNLRYEPLSASHARNARSTFETL